MSLATLKRKTQSKYNNSSVGVNQFSLHGTHRNQGYIGQTSLSRTLPRTLAKGSYNKGHGGCCDTYTDLNTPVISSVKSTEDSSVIKSSVLSTKGMLSRRLQKNCCDNVVKPDGQTTINSQSSYLEYLKNKCSQIKSDVQPDLSDVQPDTIYIDDIFEGLDFPIIYEDTLFNTDHTVQDVGLFGNNDNYSLSKYFDNFRDKYFITYEDDLGTIKTGFNVSNSPYGFQKGLYTFENDGIIRYGSDSARGIAARRHSYLAAYNSDIESQYWYSTYLENVDNNGYITITLPYSIKISNSQLIQKGWSWMPDEYKIYGIKNSVEYELLHVNRTWSINSGSENGAYEDIQIITSDRSFNKFKLQFIKNNKNGIRLQYWKLGGYYEKNIRCNKTITKSNSDINIAISQSEYLSKLKGNCLDSAPEFHQTSNSCSTGRGACGSD